MLLILDTFFLCFHNALILFNVFGWIPRATRKANLVTLSITGMSWFVLGIFYGMGYCFLTDWHYEVLYKMGKVDIPNSYIQYMTYRLFHLEISRVNADIITVVSYFVSLGVSLYVNISGCTLQKSK